jgi:hypothetical protein
MILDFGRVHVTSSTFAFLCALRLTMLLLSDQEAKLSGPLEQPG